MMKAKRVLPYLKPRMEFGLMNAVSELEKQELERLEVYTDAAYANDKQDRRSVSGHVMMMNDATIS